MCTAVMCIARGVCLVGTVEGTIQILQGIVLLTESELTQNH